MPGICGIVPVTRAAIDWNGLIQEMVQCTLHESFYESGTYCAKSPEVYLSWSSFKGRTADSQPIWNERGDVALIFNGEEYSELDTRADAFERNRYHWILQRYERYGEAFVSSLNGIFSGVLVDLARSKAFLFNDRYGLSRIYYFQTSDAFYFASEAKSLLEVLPETRQLDPQSLGEFFSIGCVLQNRSLFKGVSLLPPATIWSFAQTGENAVRTYFDKKTWEEQERIGRDEFYAELKELFPRVLRRYLAGSKKVGVSLTGGVDSRLLLAWAGATPGFLPCYTFGGCYRDPSDVTLAREIARRSQQPHQVIRVADEFLADFPALAERTVYLSDGAMDVSGAADLYVNRFAREISPIRLTGNYGGEIMRELIAFRPQTPFQQAFNSDFFKVIDEASNTYDEERSGNRLSFVAFKQVPWHHFSRLSVERSQVVMRSPYVDNDLVQLAYRTPTEWVGSNDPVLRLIADGNPELDRVATDRAILQNPIPVVSKALHLLQEFTFRAEYAYDYGMPDAVARIDSALRHLHLERIFLGRHKFHHFRIWYRDELAPYLKAVLLDPRSLGRDYVSRSNVEEMVRAHTAGHRNYTQDFHRLLTIELLQRQLIERN